MNSQKERLSGWATLYVMAVIVALSLAPAARADDGWRESGMISLACSLEEACNHGTF